MAMRFTYPDGSSFPTPSPFGKGLGRGLECPTPATPLFPGPSPRGRREKEISVDKLLRLHELPGGVT